MFRTGGTAEGITSGLAPRQGYSTGLSDELRKRKIRDVLSGESTLGEAEDLSKQLAYKPRGASMSAFLIDFGLDIASRPPSGSIFSTAAAAAKDPFSRYTAAKQSAAEQKYASESGMFKSLLEAGAEATGETGGKGWLEQWKFKQIPLLNDKVADLQGRIDSNL